MQSEARVNVQTQSTEALDWSWPHQHPWATERQTDATNSAGDLATPRRVFRTLFVPVASGAMTPRVNIWFWPTRKAPLSWADKHRGVPENPHSTRRGGTGNAPGGSGVSGQNTSVAQGKPGPGVSWVRQAQIQ